MSDGVLMQEPATVTTGTTASAETPPAVCRCGAGPHPTHAGICERGHAVRGNQLHRVHGAYSFRDRGDASLPPDLRMTVAQFKEQVTLDRGGLEELSAIEAARIGHLAEVETTLRLLASDIARNGLLTKKGRTRTVFGRWLEALDRWQKLAAHIGDGRRARQVPTLSDYLRQAPEEHPHDDARADREAPAMARGPRDVADDDGEDRRGRQGVLTSPRRHDDEGDNPDEEAEER